MQYKDSIARSIGYIEQHIHDSLTVEQIAAQSGYSPYHFCRVFTAAQGQTVMDYVRLRRLSRARAELLGGRKVLDVALDYGYETASGFTRAFHKEFGYPPGVFLKRMKARLNLEYEKRQGGVRMNREHNTKFTIGEEGIVMEPVLKTRPAFKVAGYGIKTTVAEGYLRDIAAYWDTYTGENLESKMYAQLQPQQHGEVGLCVPCGEGGQVDYLLGVVVDDFSRATPEMTTVTVPAAEYAVFTTPPVILTMAEPEEDPLSIAVKAAWKFIFEEWFPTSGYSYDEGKMDFEFYDERCHTLQGSVMEIWVPVTKAAGRG
jgi:AraC family transcriptional regulator